MKRILVKVAGVVALAGQRGSGAARFDLEMIVTRSNEQLSGLLRYSPDLFEVDTIARMVRRFEQLCAIAVANPEERLSVLAADS